MFKKYQHVERYGNEEVEDIDVGITYVFPKIDGTNASVWLDDGQFKAGSRNRELTLEKDNAGFLGWAIKQANLIRYLIDNPEHRLYGEWLVPHSLKTYRDDAWRDFYVFDVVIDKSPEEIEYIPYEIYKEKLEEYEINYIPLICKVKNGNYEKFINQLEKNTYLIKDGDGAGEGIVIKNYDYYNKYGRQKWAKIVTSEFKEKHSRSFDAPILQTSYVEEKIIDELLTEAFVEKEYSKIAIDGWSSKMISKLLGVVWNEFVNDEIWNIITKYKNPKIDFKLLQRFCTQKTKEIKKDLF